MRDVAIDTAGTLAQYPYFKQAGNEVNLTLYVLILRPKRPIWNSKSSEAGMNVFAGYTKENDSVFYLQNAKVTTAGNWKMPITILKPAVPNWCPRKNCHRIHQYVYCRCPYSSLALCVLPFQSKSGFGLYISNHRRKQQPGLCHTKRRVLFWFVGIL